jgi:hypothetical protein
MRDICKCESHGCKAKGGILLDSRTIQKHRCKDQLKIFENAKADSKHALDEQLDHISHLLSKSRLLDSPAQTSSTTNDLCHQLADLSLNSNNEAPSTKDHYSETLHPGPSSQRTTIGDVLTHLSDIGAAAAALQHDTASAFKNSVKVSHVTLDPLLVNCYSLQASLSKVTLKAAPVTLMKDNISEILSKVQVQLEATKSELVKKQKLAPRPAAPVYPTGMRFIEFIYNI